MRILSTIASIFFLLFAKAQDTSIVYKTFRATSLINFQTNEIAPKGGLNLNIQHRFGEADIKEDFLKDFFGLDNGSTTRIGFTYQIINGLQIGVGRTTDYYKTYDMSVKYQILKQTKNNRAPVSLAFYSDIVLQSSDFPEDIGKFYQQDSITPFTYNFNHRLAYNARLIIAHKLNNRFSFICTPTYVHVNIVNPKLRNDFVIIPIGGKIQLGLTTALVYEFCPIIDKPYEYYNPFALGYEVSTVGHTFQITVSTEGQVLDQRIYYSKGSDILGGKYHLGFNIYRTFWLKK